MKAISRTALALLGMATILSLGALTVPAVAADDPNGIGLTVTVSPAPTTPSPGGQGSQGSGSGTGGKTVVTGGQSSAPAPVPTPSATEFDLGGILYVSGLSSDGDWTVNPSATEVRMTFTVRNVSNTVIDSSARFWVDGPFGIRLDEVKKIPITALKPKESRVIEATLTGLGQWTFYQAHATFTPPKSVEGTELSPITRDQFFIIFPWLIAIFGIVGGALAVILRLARPTRRLVPIGSVA